MRIEQQGSEIVVTVAKSAQWTEPKQLVCPKCSMTAEGIGAKYCTGGAVEPEKSEWICWLIAAEHLHIACHRCAYIWLMETKEQGEQRVKESAADHGLSVGCTAFSMNPLQKD